MSMERNPFVIETLVGDEVLRRHEFPVCGDKIFLVYTGVSPLSRRVSSTSLRCC